MTESVPHPIWSRQEKESTKAYEAFCLYRDMGTERSNAKVAEKLGKAVQLINRWSSKWGWVNRSVAWDDHLDAMARKKMEKKYSDMQERHLREAQAAQGLGISKFSEVQKQIASGQPNPLSIKDAIAALDFGIKHERLALGEPTAVIDIPRIKVELVNPNGGEKA